MKAREFDRLLRTEVLPSLSGWAVRGDLLYLSEPPEILRGISFDTSSYAASVVYVEAFAMPLYVPSNHINYSFGQRLRNGSNWEQWSVDVAAPKVFANELLEAMERVGIPWIGRFADVAFFVKFINDMPRESINIHLKQVLAYSLAYQGKVDAAVPLLTALAAEAEAIVEISPWAKPIGERAKYLVQLAHKRADSVQAALLGWMEETREVLKLPVHQERAKEEPGA